MAESHPSERSGGTEQQQVQLAERQLLPNHEHIIVGLPPFWAVTSPDAAALRAHFFLRVQKFLSSSLPPAESHSHHVVPLYRHLIGPVGTVTALWASELGGAAGHVRDACLWAGVPGALPDRRPPGALCCQADHASKARPGSLVHSASQETPEVQGALNPEIAMIAL